MNEASRYELLNDLAKYYPLGAQIDFESYLGYEYWKAKVASKIERIDLKDNPWNLLMNLFRKNGNLREAQFDVSFWQFPSYSVCLELSKELSGTIERTRTFCLDVSLLTDYYTVFLEDVFVFMDLHKNGTSQSPPKTYILSTQMAGDNTFNEYSDLIHEKINLFFPAHRFLKHNDLFDFGIESCIPYHGTHLPGFNYLIYDFLFCHYYQNKYLFKLQILE